MPWKERTELLIGKDGAERLKNSSVLLFGLGGVGGMVAEALVRGGIGRLDVFDGDVFSETNLNRQIFCTLSTIGKNKALVAAKRLLDINPELKINAYPEFFTDKTELDFSEYDYVIDAIDSKVDKLAIVKRAKESGISVISCMGTGNKLNTSFKVADISKTQGCPLAKTMRKLFKDNGISDVKTVYSEEIPLIRGKTPASISFVPPSAGLVIAGEVIRDILKGNA